MNAQPQPPQPQISIISDKSPSNVTVFIPNLLLLSIHRLIIQNSVPLANHNSAIESIRWFRLLWFSWIFNAYIFFSNFFYIVLIKTCSVWDCLVVFFSACFKVKRTSTHPRWASFFVVVIVLLVSFRKCTVTLLFLVIWGGALSRWQMFSYGRFRLAKCAYSALKFNQQQKKKRKTWRWHGKLI